MDVVYIPDDNGAQWDAYVAARTDIVTDLAGWRRVVRDGYGIGSHFLAAKDGGRIAGTLGLYEIRHALFGHYLTTAPFGNDGGLHVDSDAAREALVAEARTLASRLRVSYLLIRSRDIALDGFQVDDHYRTAVLDLSDGSEALWKRLPNKTRNQVRRGQKEGFAIATGHEQLGAFFDVFHEHMRDLGSPAHSRRYYEAIAEHMAESVDFVVLRDGHELVAGAMLFRTKATAMNLHTVALRRFNKRCPNYLIYWTMIESSAARGCRSFDMGRSEAGSSIMQFKANWGPSEVTLHYNYYLVRAKEVPYLDPRNRKFRAAVALWQRLPLSVTKLLGPRLISGLA